MDMIVPVLSVSEPIDLSDVRSYLAMDPEDVSEDPILTEAISFCRDRLESILPYYIAERDVRETRDLCSWCLMPEESMELRGPVLSVDKVSAVLSDGTAVDIPLEMWFVFNGRLTVCIRDALEELGTDLRPIGIVCDYHAGAYVPPVVKNALLMMVRNRYERRDEDPLTEAVLTSVYPETRPNI